MSRPGDEDEAPRLRQRIEAERMRADAIATDLDIERKNRLRAERALHAVQQELGRVREEDPESDRVRRVCEYWRKVCRDGSKRVQLPLGGARAKAVKARLREMKNVTDQQAEEMLITSIDGYAKAPFVVNAQRVAHGERHQRFDDLELICRNEKTVERGVELATSRPPVGDVWSERVERMVYGAVDAVHVLREENAKLREVIAGLREVDESREQAYVELLGRLAEFEEQGGRQIGLEAA